ncbi:hypothetical protein [Enterococcus sp. AZ072]|uniref:hypothetical protein n=1 Tax=unclassified Enterococcus TaxID=2608891 RepID=UPI003D2AEB15
MEQNETFNDWLFRYQYVYRVRRTAKQKRRFITALVTDIAKMREDIQVIEYNRHKKYAANNIYVGDIKKADQIICTYYDTPPQHFGPYYLFDRKKQSKGTTSFILVSALLTLLAGLLFTLAYMQVAPSAFDLSSPLTILVAICYGAYFIFLSKIAKGLSSRQTLIRNTSSILAILQLINSVKNKKIAFAFIDEGAYGEVGLNVLQDSCKASAKIYSLDAVGAHTELQVKGKGFSSERLQQAEVHQHPSIGNITYLFGANVSETTEGTQYVLDKTALKQKTLNMENLTKIIKLFE